MIFLIQQTFICTIPLLIVAMAGMFAERSGIINIALDGIMIVGAFGGALTVYLFIDKGILTEKAQLIYVIAMLISAVIGALFSLLLSFSAVKLKSDQTISGTALNLLAPALALFIIKIFFMQDKLVMPTLPGGVSLNFVLLNPDLPGFLQAFFSRAYISTYIVLGLYIVLSVLLYKTRFGLRMRSCGEHPQAADSVGINVAKMRYLGTTISGALGGLGGFIYITTSAGGTASGTVAGMGFLAIAIMIFGNWKPVGIALGSFLFGLLRCVGSSYASLDLNGDGVFLLKDLGLPMYFYNIIPYAAVLIVLMFTAGKSRAPKAEGIPYDKGQR
ncbi:MAG: ABC transporter permease [Clostridia bacterium]|nr:ABC transporter permease [Clostridia bacterium]